MLRKIEISELNQLYSKHIKKDFPTNERPPCFIIKKNIENKLQEGFIYREGNEEFGYAINTLTDEIVLILLFATYSNKRQKGKGTSFLKELIQYYADKKVLIVEVEKPEVAQDEKQRIICEKRISFYEKSGFVIHKDIDYSIFGVPMYLMTYSKDKLDREEVIINIREVYSKTLGKTFQGMLKAQ